MPAHEADHAYAPTGTPPRWRWDLFCRVVDNYGDLGVCRRLAQHLATRGQCVRLWVDDAALLHRMAPELPAADAAFWRACAAGVAWVHWQDELDQGLDPGDVVVEAFGCDPPASFVARMAHRVSISGNARTTSTNAMAATAAAPRAHDIDHRAPQAPLWLNLEYLSAEDYVARSHRLPSPQASGPGRGLTKWFFYPGFTADTGGLLREHDLPERRAAFDRDAWLQGWGLRATDERRLSLFAYEQAPLEDLLKSLAEETHPAQWRLMVTQGPLQARAQHWLQARPAAAQRIGITALPWLSSQDFDHLLWACDLNFVRGEDSLVRALWAGAPFVWQIYPQHDGAHAAKLQAFWAWLQASALNPHAEHATGQPAHWARTVHPWWQAWNQLTPWPAGAAWPWQSQAPWRQAVTEARDTLTRRPSLAQALLDFVAQQRPAG